MSMFDNLVLDEFTMLDEGKQADEYRAKKDPLSKENMDKRRAEHSRSKERYIKQNIAGSYDPEGRKKYEIEKQNRRDSYMKAKRDKTSSKEELDKKKNNMYSPSHTYPERAVDAINRHARRHPKTESALMLIAGYNSEFAY